MPRRLSIATIVTIGLVAATTLLLGILGVVGYNSFRDRQWEDFRQEHAILADQLATSLTLPLWNFDREQIGKVIESLAPDHDVQAVVVQSAGTPSSVHARARDGAGKLKPVDAPVAVRGLLEEKRAILMAGDTLGSVQIYVTTQFLEARLRQALFSMIGAILLLDLLLIVGLYLLLRRTVLRPLQEVERYAVAVSSSGSPDGILPGRSYLGELDSLRLAIGKMVGLLAARFAAMQKSEGRYRLLAENVGDVIWTLDPAGRITYVSPSVERLLGFTPEEVMCRTLEELLAPASAVKLRQLLSDIIGSAAQGRPYNSGRIELENIDRHGASKWAENTYECLPGPDGGLAGILAVCRDITERRAAEAERAQAQLREQEARKEFTRKLIASQETERHRIASELHDSLGQDLLLIKNRAQLALIPSGVPAELRQQVEGIAALATQAIAGVRQISHDLRPYQLDQLGLTRALQGLIDAAAQSTGIAFQCRLEPVDEFFPGEAATGLYRIVQEGLNNILKHSGATKVRIELERDVRRVRLWIEDDGRGFEDRGRASTGIATGFGLQNISERVDMLGGRLVIDSAPGAGTRLEVIIPVAEAG